MPVYDALLKKDGTPRSNPPVIKDGKRYFFEAFWVDNNGKRRKKKSKKYKSPKTAANAERAFLANLGEIEDESMTFKQLEELYLAKRKNELRPNVFINQKAMLKHMTDQLGNITINKLTIQQYQKALYELDNMKRNGKPFSARYKNTVINNFKAMITYGKKMFNLTTDVPNRFDSFKDMPTLTKNNEMKFITHEQFMQLISVVDDPQYDALFTTLYFMGLRIGEANALRWHDINFDKNTLSVNKTISTKRKDEDGNFIENPPKTSTSNRTLPMPNIVRNKLMAIYDLFSTHDYFNEQWFVFGGNRPLSESTVTNIKNKYFAKAELEPIRLHDFRHSCASYLINNLGIDNIMLISRYLGHKDVAMTLNRYSHLYRSKLEDLVLEINELEKKGRKSSPKSSPKS